MTSRRPDGCAALEDVMRINKYHLLLVGIVATALVVAPGAAAAMSVLPVNFWADSLSLTRARELVDGANSVFDTNGVDVMLTLGGVGPMVDYCSAPSDVDGVNISFIPASMIPGGGAEVAASNSLPLGANSAFCGGIAAELTDWSGTELLLAHAIGHMLSLGHTEGTVMSTYFGEFTNFDSSQVKTLNLVAPQAVTPPATAGDGGLLLNGRFAVQTRWVTDQGGEGSGVPAALTVDSGYFWFFAQDNIEVTIKVLDACALNQRYWVFAAGMTNVKVTLIVTDTQTGATKTYMNPQGKPFQPLQDTNAFATCP